MLSRTAYDKSRVEAGVGDLLIMKTTRSAFSGFPHDEWTTATATGCWPPP